MASPPVRGLDLIAHLNLAGPRSFLLQVEDEFEALLLDDAATASAASDAVASTAIKTEVDGEGVAAEVKTEVDADGGAAGQAPAVGVGATAASGAEDGRGRDSAGAPDGAGPRRLVFPPLARSYEELLMATATRFRLHAEPVDERRGRGRRLMVTDRGQAALPLLSYADFMRAQRLPGPPAPAPAGALDSDARLQRLRLRLWALTAAEGTDSSTRPEATGDGQTTSAEEESTLRAAVSAALKRADVEAAQGSGGGGNTSDSDAERLQAAPPRGSGAARKRGRGFEGGGGGEPPPPACTRHCYRSFGPEAAGRLYLRDDFARAPWPTAKLRRLAKPPVLWRPAWRVGPDDGDMAERGATGGIISWAVEPAGVRSGEGFEVSLRSGPGPAPGGAASGERAMAEPAAGDENPERGEHDFVLSFRRGEGVWHFTAGRRGRAAGGTQKALPDPLGQAGRRQMFWAACAECRYDGKHYVVVGRVPGMLTEHFFVAKVGRPEPLSHAGFSYLPEPGRAAFGAPAGAERPPLILESITVYPHGLTGDLPFISLRFVEQRRQRAAAGDATAEAEGEEQGEQAEALVRAALPAEDGEAGLELAVRRAALPAPTGDGVDRFAGWFAAARRECGLPLPPREEEERARRAAKRARMRVEVRPVLQNPSETPSSWGPCPAELPPLGPFDDTLRHDPASWGAAAEKAEEADHPRPEPFDGALRDIPPGRGLAATKVEVAKEDEG